MNSKKIVFNHSIAILAAATASFLSTSPALAANDTWVGSADATWANPTNWGGTVPGSTLVTTSTDTATFSAASPAFGTGANPVIIDSGRNIGTINFDTTAGAYVIGSTTGAALTLTAGGAIQNLATMTSGNIETVNAPLTLEGNYTFANNAAASASGLQIGGSINADTGVSSILTLRGTNTGTNNIVSGLIGAAGPGTVTGIVKADAGFWDITGNNSNYSGTTAINAGTLSLGNANALGTGSITLDGGTLAADTSVALSNNILVTNGAGVIDAVGGAHSITTSGNIVTTSTFGTPAVLINNMTGGSTFSVTGSTYLANNTSNVGELILGGAGNTSLDTIYGGPIGNSSIGSELFYYGTGTLTLNGTNNATGPENLLGGTVVVNENGDGEGSILGNDANALTLGSNLILSGGSDNTENITELVVAGSAALSYQANVSASAGSGNTINIGTLLGGGVSTVNFQPGVAFTTTASGAVGASNKGNTGIYGGWAVAGYGLNSENFATDLTGTSTSSAIVGLPNYLYSLYSQNTAYVELLPNLSGASAADTGAGNFLSTKFDTSNGTTAGVYNYERNNVLMDADGGSNSLLFTGFANLTLGGNAMVGNGTTSSASTGITYLEQYGTGTVTISNNIYGNGYFVALTTGGTATPLNGNVASFATGPDFGSTSFGALVKSGPGTAILTGTNNYVGNTYINGGTLSISSDSNLGGINGTLSVAAATTASTSVTVTGELSYQDLVGASFLGTTITGQSGSTGTITLTLAAPESATVGSDPYANGQQLIELNGGTLQATNSFTLGETNGTLSNYRPITLGVNGGTIDVTGANTLVAPGVVSQTTGGTGQLVDLATGVASFTKVDTGTLVFAGSNTYTGGTAINGGTLVLDFGAVTAATPAIANFTYQTTNVLAAGGAVSLGGGTLNMTDSSTTTAVDTQTIASLALTGGNNTVSMTHNGATSSMLTVTNGTINRVTGTTVDFISPASTSIVLAGNDNNSFIGNYAFFGSGTTEGYASTTSTGAVQAATLAAATTANNFTSATGNYSYNTSGVTPDTLTGSATANTFVNANTTAQTISLGTSNFSLTLNGILNNNGALTIQNGVGGTGSVAIGSTNELIIGGSSSVAISAPITGTGALTDSDTSTLTLSSANTYTGPTTVNSGVLALTGGSLTGSNITTAGSAVVAQSSTNVIGGTGTTFTQASTGTSSLAGSNTYTGLTTVSNGELDLSNTTGQSVAGSVAVSGGILKLTNSNQIATTGSLAVSGGTVNVQSFNQTLAGLQLTGGMLLGTTGTLTSNSAFDIEAGVDSAILGGSAGLTKSTTGVALITSANSYTGTTTINAGTLYISALNNLGTSTSAVVLGGGTLYYTGSAVTYTRGFTLTANSEIDSSASGTFTIGTNGITGSGFTTTFGGTSSDTSNLINFGSTAVTSNIATGSGGVIMNEFGTLTLSGSNTYTGLTTINNGILNVGSGLALGGGGNITFNGGTVQNTGLADTSNTGVLQFSALNSTDYSSKIINSAGLINIDTNSQTVTFASNLASSNTGGLAKIGAGKLILSGSNAYTGTTYIDAGELTLASAGALGSSTGSIVFNGGTLGFTSGNTTDYSSRIKSSTGAISIDTGGQNVTFATALPSTNNTGLTKLGQGTLTLSAANLYTGTTAVNAGTLDLAFGTTPTTNILTAAALSLGGGTLQIDSGTSGTNSQTMTTLAVASGASTISLVSHGTSTSDALTLSGALTRTAGATVDFVTPTNTSATFSLAAEQNLTFMGTYAFYGTGTNEAYAATSATGLVQAAASTAATSATSFATGGNYSYNAASSPDTLTANTAANSFINVTTGAQVLSLGGSTFTLTVNGIINDGGALTIQEGSGGTGTVVDATELVLGGGSNIAISAPISGAGALTDSDTGTLSLSGSNTYAGVTTINGGTLVAANLTGTNNNLGSNATSNALAINDGGILSFNGTTATGTYARNITIGAGGGEIDDAVAGQTLALSGTIAATPIGSVVTFGGQGNTTTTGVISGPGGLTKNGSGTLTLATATNTYYGATSVNAGTLSVTSSIAAGSVVSVGGVTGATTATLAGTGIINGSVTTSSLNSNVAHLAPGVNVSGTNFGTAGTLTIAGALTIGTGTNLDIDLSSSTSAGNDLIAMTGTGANGVLTIAGSTTINLSFIGTGALTTGSTTSGFYTLVSGATSSNFTNATYSATVVGSTDTAHIFTSGNNLDVYFTSNGTGTATPTTYTLGTTAGSTLLHAGASTTLTTALTNTGTGTADSITYTGVGASTTLGTVSGGSISGNLANGNASVSNTNQTFSTTAGTSGTATISSTGTLTNATVGGTPTGTPTGTSIQVYSGFGTWNTNGSGTWGTTPTATPVNWTAAGGTPGVTAGFTGVDTATFGAQTTSAITVGLNGAAPNLNAITFSSPGTAYTLAQNVSGGTGTSSITLSGTTPSINVTNPGNSVTDGTQTISAPLILGATTSLNVAASQTLNISGQVSSSGTFGLSNSGPGATMLSNASGNIYSGPTTISGGTVYISNTSGSATGSGLVTVNSGGVLAGNGMINGAGVTVNGGGSLVSGSPSQVSGTGLTSLGGMSLAGTTPLTVGSGTGTAKLTFDLAAGNSGLSGSNAGYQSFSNPNNNTTYLSLNGSSSVNFAGATSISLVDLTNTSGANGSLSLLVGTPYLLIHAGSNTDYLNLVINSGTNANPVYSLSQNDATVNGYVLGVATGSGTLGSAGSYTPISISQYEADGVTPLTAGPGGVYPSPALYLDGGNLEVVPEPGTWALMIGGLALLVVIQRRRNKI